MLRNHALRHASVDANESASNPVTDFVGTSRIDALIQSIGVAKDKNTESIHTLNRIESQLEKLETAQDSLTELVASFGRERDTLNTQVEDLRRQRDAASRTATPGVRIDPSGLWKGESGIMRIRLSANHIEGDYDWKGRSLCGDRRNERPAIVLGVGASTGQGELSSFRLLYA